VKGIWRFRDLLPETEYRITLGEGNTPLIEISRGIFLKDERVNPTGSFEDRFSAFFVSYLKSTGRERTVCNWDYDRIISLASYCARAGIKFYTKHTTMPLILLGAESSREDEDVLLKNLDLHVGEKTTTYEILLNSSFDSVILPVGSGSHLVMSVKAGIDLIERGEIDRLPRYYGAVPEKKRESVASYLIGHNYFGPELKKLMDDGFIKLIEVSEGDIISAQEDLGKEGVLASPSACISFAGREKVEGDDVVCVIAGDLKMENVSISETKLMILRHIYRKPTHGYALWKWLNGLKKITPQAVYQHLYELTERGYLRSVKKGEKEVYYITELGKSAIIDNS